MDLKELEEFDYSDMIDSHAHFEIMDNRGVCATEAIEFCEKKGFYSILDVGTKPSDLSTRLKYANDGIVKTACGICPQAVEECNTIADVDKLTKTLYDLVKSSSKKIVAIGECGLELFLPIGKLELQKRLLINQIEIANELSLPILIHNRAADEALLKLFKENKIEKRGLIHCFSSTLDVAKKFIDLGFKISFSGNLTFATSVQIAEAATHIPLECILTETDSPYLAPKPLRKELNRPWFVYFVYKKLSELKGIEMREVISQVKKNYNQFFSI